MNRKTPYSWSYKRIKKSPFYSNKRTIKQSIALAQDKERDYLEGNVIGYSYVSSLKSMGRIPRTDGTYKLGDNYS